jgi:photosystem II stability/assembly factor-like uncharacterized protein
MSAAFERLTRFQGITESMRQLRILVLCAAICALASAHAFAWTDPVDAHAEIMPLVANSLKLGLVKSGDRIIAVGGRGEIVYSTDTTTWTQAHVPTRATFTAVAAIDANVWAVGHEGVIAHSADAGEHWTIQRKDPLKIGSDVDDATRDPQQGAPLLGVLFTDAQHGMAVGAYSLALRTDDGGEHWNPMTVASPADKSAAKNDDDIDDDTAPAKNDGKMTFSERDLKIGQEATPHLNAIARTGSGGLIIVGERGSAFQSHDDGKTWKRIQLPYDGSMFGVLGFDGDHALAFGLRGHVYETADLGTHWAEVETKTELTLLGGTVLPDGGAVIVGANGIILARLNGHDEMHGFIDTPAGILAAVTRIGERTVLVAGENGLSTFTAPSN